MRKKEAKKRLTPAEEEIMQILWKQGKGLVKDILKDFTNPKPAYNTVSTVLRVMEKKGFVAHNKVGVFYEFYPLIAKDKYSKNQAKIMLKNYYNNSLGEFVGTFANDLNVSEEQLVKILAVLGEKK